jgi:hypothetical protein
MKLVVEAATNVQYLFCVKYAIIGFYNKLDDLFTFCLHQILLKEFFESFHFKMPHRCVVKILYFIIPCNSRMGLLL